MTIPTHIQAASLCATLDALDASFVAGRADEPLQAELLTIAREQAARLYRPETTSSARPRSATILRFQAKTSSASSTTSTSI